jgi:multidrug efflux pump subunit AcrA (membrane-fusion protein)
MAKGDLKDQLGSFVKGALAQLDSVREVVVQKSRAGKIQIDVAMLKRRRRDALAEIGRVVVELAAKGRLSEDDFPEIGPALAQLEALDEKIAAEEERARRVATGHEDPYYEDGESEEDAEDEDEAVTTKDGP